MLEHCIQKADRQDCTSRTGLLFSKSNDFFLGYFDPEKFFLEYKMKLNDLQGDLPDVSVETEPLLLHVWIVSNTKTIQSESYAL